MAKRIDSSESQGLKYPEFPDLHSDVKPSLLLNAMIALNRRDIQEIGEINSHIRYQLAFIAQTGDRIQLIGDDAVNENYPNFGFWVTLSSNAEYDSERKTHIWKLTDTRGFTRELPQNTVTQLLSPDTAHPYFRIIIKMNSVRNKI